MTREGYRRADFDSRLGWLRQGLSMRHWSATSVIDDFRAYDIVRSLPMTFEGQSGVCLERMGRRHL